jgi:hypothetical protein
MATPTRWAPWIEGVNQTGDIAPVTTTVTVVPGLTVTIVPHINTRALVTASLVAEFTATASLSELRAGVYVNGVAVNPQVQQGGSSTALAFRELEALSLSVVVNLTKETSYTIDVRVNRTTASGSTINVLAGGVLFGGMQVTAMPRLHN